jgi:hypothetical protein
MHRRVRWVRRSGMACTSVGVGLTAFDDKADPKQSARNPCNVLAVTTWSNGMLAQAGENKADWSMKEAPARGLT